MKSISNKTFFVFKKLKHFTKNKINLKKLLPVLVLLKDKL